MAKDTFLVTGGTGNIGTAFVANLAAASRDHVVRVATRDPRSRGARLVAALDPKIVQPVAFDLENPASLRAAFEGVTKLFVIAPFVSDMASWHHKVATAARETGTVNYAVKVSVTGARGPAAGSPPGRIPLSHWQGEEALRGAGFPTTMIRPTIFMQHFLSVKGLYTARSDRFYLPTGEAKIAWLDCRDIADFAAGILLASAEKRAPFVDRAFEVTGPRPHTASEIAEILSLVARRPVNHVDGVEAFSARCKEVGSPDVVRGVYAEASEGWFGTPDDAAFVRLLGRHTTSFAKFAIDHAEHFGDGTAE